jgi:hypothetical protein
LKIQNFVLDWEYKSSDHSRTRAAANLAFVFHFFSINQNEKFGRDKVSSGASHAAQID